MTRLELIQEGKKMVSKIAKATKSLQKNDAYRVMLVENNNGDVVITKYLMGNWTENTHLSFWNEPMTKKQVLAVLEEAENYENQY